MAKGLLQPGPFLSNPAVEGQGYATGRLADQHQVVLPALLTCLLLAEQRDRPVPPDDLKPQAVATIEERKQTSCLTKLSMTMLGTCSIELCYRPVHFWGIARGCQQAHVLLAQRHC